jgi:hypothetical protein
MGRWGNSPVLGQPVERRRAAGDWSGAEKATTIEDAVGVRVNTFDAPHNKVVRSGRRCCRR